MRLVLMGAPGSGKGTYAEVLEKHFRIPHISTGVIIRNAIAKKTPMGVIAKTYIDEGNLVPDDIANEIVKERLKEKDCENGFMLDGYPRTIAQGENLTRALKDLGLELDAAINLEIDESLVIERIINRRYCPNCGRGYNIKTIKPIVEGLCDDCKVPLLTRDDDNEETVKSRLVVYNNLTKPLVSYYEKLGKLISIDSNRSIEEVVNDIIHALEE